MGSQMPKVGMSAEQREYKKLKKEAEDIPPSGVKLKSLSITEPFLSEQHTPHWCELHPILPNVHHIPTHLRASPYPTPAGQNAHLFSRLPPDASSSQRCQAWLSEHFLHCSVPHHSEAPHTSLHHPPPVALGPGLHSNSSFHSGEAFLL